jgi:hypothetical protein
VVTTEYKVQRKAKKQKSTSLKERKEEEGTAIDP